MLPSTDARRQALEKKDVVAQLLVALHGNNQQNDFERAWTDGPADTSARVSVFGLYTTHTFRAGADSGAALYEYTLPRESGGPERSLMSLGLLMTDDSLSFQTQYDEGRHLNLSVDIWVSFPAINNSVPIHAYAGRCAEVQFVEDEQAGPIARLQFTGPLAKRDEEHRVITSDHNQRQRDSTDSSLRFAHASIDLKWGKK